MDELERAGTYYLTRLLRQWSAWRGEAAAHEGLRQLRVLFAAAGITGWDAVNALRLLVQAQEVVTR